MGAAQAERRGVLHLRTCLTGEEALRLGVVSHESPAKKIEEAGRAWALQLAGLPTVAIGYMKRNLNAAHEHATLSEVLDIEAQNMVRTQTAEDHKVASAAFVRKESPNFQGR